MMLRIPLTIGLLLMCVSFASAQSKIALVVGVAEYAKAGLGDLDYAALDADELADELSKNGFQVTRLTANRATKSAVDSTLDGFYADASKLNKKDLAIIAFSGHGLQRTISVERKVNGRSETSLVETPFFCVYDTLKSDPKTMISLNEVIQQLEERSGCLNNFLLVDACRDNSTKGVKNLDGGTVQRLPAKINILFSTSPGKVSYEADSLGHGVFTHVLLEGLRGKAANSRGDVDWLSLAAFVVREVQIVVKDAKDDQTLVQIPNLVGNAVGSPILANVKRSMRTPPRPQRRSPKTFISISTGMQFVLIPRGQFKMGSPTNEGFRDEELEQLHDVVISRDFYIGKFEVTRGEFQKFLADQGRSLAEFDTGLSSSGKKSSCPIVNVSHRDAEDFVKWLSRKEGRSYRLPTEAEWEYACRAGSQHAFCYGYDANRLAKFAWFIDEDDDGSSGFPQVVGMKQANDFGVHDMHGNVAEFCLDFYDPEFYKTSPGMDPLATSDQGKGHVVRGGSWASDAFNCRSANRSRDRKPKSSKLGFRVVLEIPR